MVEILKETRLAKVRAERRGRRVRSRLVGTDTRPRLSVFRSGKHIYAQLINDEKGVTLAAADDLKISKEAKRTKVQEAEEVARILVTLAKKLSITKVIFDRGSYRYHGRIKALAEKARSGGLIF